VAMTRTRCLARDQGKQVGERATVASLAGSRNRPSERSEKSLGDGGFAKLVRIEIGKLGGPGGNDGNKSIWEGLRHHGTAEKRGDQGPGRKRVYSVELSDTAIPRSRRSLREKARPQTVTTFNRGRP